MPLTVALLQVKVEANTEPAQASLGAMNEKVAASHGMFAGMLSQIGSFVAGQVIFALMAQAMMELHKQIKDVFTQTAAWGDATTQLKAVLASTNTVAGFTSDAAIKLADSLSTVTRFNNTAVLETENLLLTFTALSKDVMPQATETVLNMAQALNEDTKSAAIQLGKALQDPVLGMTALRRVGVNFSKDQIAVVKQLVATGQTAKAQALILKELQTEFGGSARAAGTDMAGKLAILNNQFDIVKQTIGEALIPVLTDLLAKIAPLVIALAENLPAGIATVKTLFHELTDYAANLTAGMDKGLLPVMHQASDAMNTSIGPAVVQLGKWIASTLIPAVMQVAGWISEHIIPILLVAAKVIAQDFMPTWEKIADVLIKKFLPPVERIVGDILPVLIPLLQAVGWIFANVVGPALLIVLNALASVVEFISRLIDLISTLIHGDFSKLPGMLTAAGKAAMDMMNPFHAAHGVIPGFAEGGVVPGGLTMVGERGPEIVQLPGGSHVFAHGSGPGGGSGGNMQASTFIIQLDGRVIAQQTLKHAPGVIRLATGARNF